MNTSLARLVFGWMLALLLLPLAAQAQEGSIFGTVADEESGDPLPGANVVVVGLERGAATNIDGEYEISGLSSGEYTLRISYVGFLATEQEVIVPAGEAVEENILLRPDFTGLEEVVVTGIASETSRARAEVAVSSIDVAGLQTQNAYQDVSQVLAAKVAGVNVQPASGNVGGGIRFNVRSGGGLGAESNPVIYIDGIRVENEEVEGFGAGGQGVSTLASLNPEDIENIEVLKGSAAAALYGTSGSNGVVLVTTKSGQVNTPLSVRYKGVLGVNQQIEDYDLRTSPVPDVANSIFRDGAIQQHSLSVSGGSDIVRYYASFDRRDEEGALRNNELERNSFRVNLETFPFDNVTLRATASYSSSNIFRPQNDNNIFGYLGNTTISRTPFVFTDSVSIEGVENVQRLTNFVGSIQAEYEPIERLALRATVGFDGNDLRNDETFPADLAFSTVVNGERNIFERRNEQLTYDVNARYTYPLLDGLEATTIVGAQAFDRTLRQAFLTKQNFASSLVSNIGAGDEFIDGDEDFIDTRELGVFAQQEFEYRDRYFLTLGLRRDFATAIGAEAPDIYYPKVSAAVRLDQFGFLPEYVNLLKPRAAYGETGTLPERLDAAFLRWSAEPSGYGGGAVVDFVGNTEIEPPRVREIEAGVDAELFGRATLGLTYYRRFIENEIIDFRDAPSTGLTATTNTDFEGRPFNVGEAEGQGVEVELGVTPIRTPSTSLDLTFLYAYQTNEVTNLGGAQPIFDGFDINVIREGLPQAAFYTYTSRAAFDEAGVFTGAVPAVVDADGNPVREFVGTPVPSHTGSFSVNFRFLRNFNLYGLLDFATGLSVFSNTRSFQVQFGADRERNIAGYLIGESGFEEFTDEDLVAGNLGYLVDLDPNSLQPGTEAYREAAETYAGLAANAGGVSTDGNFVEDADFLKLREISLSYDFTDLINRFSPGERPFIQGLTFALTARNIVTFTEYDSGLDPEVNFDGAEDLSRGIDFLTLAPPRTLYGTLTVRF